MNYQKIYDSIITRALHRRKMNKQDADYVYYERHHVIPKCLGGTNSKSNLVYLAAEEHWVAHLLLVKLNPGNNKLVFACKAMSMSGGNNKRTANKLFGWIRREYGKATSERQKGREVTVSTREKISKALEGRLPEGYQKLLNPEVVKKAADSKRGKKMVFSDPEGRNRKISKSKEGHPGLKGDANPASWRVSCISCKKETSVPCLGRDHKKCVDK